MYHKEKRIPTLIALLIIFLGISGVVFIDKSSLNFTSSANPVSIPQEVHITDVSDKSFVVSWISAQPVLGSIIVSNNNNYLALLDDLDNDNIPRPRITHYVTVNNLTEDTLYTIKIISGSNKCTSQSSCPVFTQKTPARLPSFTSLSPAKGQIVTRDNQPATNSIVYLIIGKSAPLSGRVDSLGLWVIPFHNLRSGDLTTRMDIADNDIVQITVKSSENESTSAVVDIKSIRQNLTIPTMQMGNSYNFINLISKKDLFADNPYDQKVLGAQTNYVKISPATLPTITNISGNNTIDVIFPAKDQDTSVDNRPKLRGIGPKGTTLLITVNSTPQTAKIIVGQDGTWSYRPPKILSPGVHHLSIQGYDAGGQLITVTREFIVLKDGESVLGEATSSATITPRITLSPTITPHISTTVSPSPTVVIIPTLTIIPTIAPTVFNPPPPALTSPRSGSFEPTMLLFGISSVLLIAGAKLLMFP